MDCETGDRVRVKMCIYVYQRCREEMLIPSIHQTDQMLSNSRTQSFPRNAQKFTPYHNYPLAEVDYVYVTIRSITVLITKVLFFYTAFDFTSYIESFNAGEI